MEKNGFPGLNSHKAEHKAMTEQLLKFQNDLQAGKLGVPTALMPFLQKWLHDHLLETRKNTDHFSTKRESTDTLEDETAGRRQRRCGLAGEVLTGRGKAVGWRKQAEKTRRRIRR
jgi:hypothetical protein